MKCGSELAGADAYETQLAGFDRFGRPCRLDAYERGPAPLCAYACAFVEKSPKPRLITPARLAYFRVFNAVRQHDRRQRALALLGGKCVSCGATDRLEFDHKERAGKRASISSIVRNRWEEVVLELAKCQLLCVPCHVEKTAREQVREQRFSQHLPALSKG